MTLRGRDSTRRRGRRDRIGPRRGGGAWARALATVAALGLAATVFAHQEPAADALQSMADAERAFAKASAARGMRAAFLEFLADDAIGFHPPFGRARDEWASRPEDPNPLATTLEWDPRTGGVSADGRLGWLTGPYTIVPNGDRPKTGYGCYFSVWRRAGNGPWRVLMDLGISTPDPCVMPRTFEAVPPRTTSPSTREALVEMERYAVEFGKGGLEQTLITLSDPHLRVQLDRRQPLVGRKVALEALKPDPTPWTFTLRDAFVSGSGDLGVTYGEARSAGSATPGTYVRVWRPDEHGHWKVVFQTIAG